MLPPQRAPSNTEKLPTCGRLALLQALKVAKAQKQAIKKLRKARPEFRLEAIPLIQKNFNDKRSANSVEKPQKEQLEIHKRRDCGSVEVPKHRGTKAANRYSPLNNTFSSDDEESPLERQLKLDSDSLASIMQELKTTENRNANKTSDHTFSTISEVVAGTPILEVAQFVPEEDDEVDGLKPIQKLQLGFIRHRTFAEESKIPKADIGVVE